MFEMAGPNLFCIYVEPELLAIRKVLRAIVAADIICRGGSVGGITADELDRQGLITDDPAGCTLPTVDWERGIPAQVHVFQINSRMLVLHDPYERRVARSPRAVLLERAVDSLQREARARLEVVLRNEMRRSFQQPESAAVPLRRGFATAAGRLAAMLKPAFASRQMAT